MDNVNHPSHYTKGSIECIDAIESALGKSDFQAYCQGNILKYVWRWKEKGGIEDLKKARWYIDRIVGEEVYEFPPMENVEAFEPIDMIEKMREELDEIRAEIMNGDRHAALLESIDLDHANETFKRSMMYTPKDIIEGRREVYAKNEKRGYYG